MLMDELKIKIKDVSHENAVFLKRHEYYLDDELVGTSEYDTDARVYRGSLQSTSGTVYAGSPEGIAWKLQRKLATLTNKDT